MATFGPNLPLAVDPDNPLAGVGRVNWDRVIKYLFLAAGQREQIFNGAGVLVPRGGAGWQTGICTSLTSTVLTDTTRTTPFAMEMGKSYRIVFGSGLTDTPWLTRDAGVVSVTDTTVTYSDQHFSSDDIAAFSGQRYTILHAEGDPLYWAKRTPWTNSVHYTSGTTSAVTRTTITDSTALWTDGLYNGLRIAFLSNGVTRYGAITATNAKVVTPAADSQLTFTSSFIPDSGAQYAVLDPGGHWTFNREQPRMTQWYGGAEKSVYSRDVNDTVHGKGQPKPTVDLLTGDACDIIDQRILFDNDLWTDVDDTCNPKNTSYAPDFWKQGWLRALQCWVDGILQRFLIPKDYTGLPIIPDNVFNASYYNFVGMTGGTTTVSGVSHNTITIPAITIPGDFVYVWWELFYQGASLFQGCQKMSGSQTTIMIVGIESDQTQYLGASVVYSFHYTRKCERHYQFDQTAQYMNPDTDEDGAPITPSATNPGNWQFRAKSTTYSKTDDDYNPDGSTNPSDTIGRTIEGTESFIEGDLVRYVPPGWASPTTTIEDGVVDQLAYATWIDKGTREGISAAEQTAGSDDDVTAWAATSGGTYFFTDSSKALYVDGADNPLTGTATITTSNSLSDITKSSDQRWDDSLGWMIGHILTITSGSLIGQKFPITSFTKITQTCTSSFMSGLTGTPTYSISAPLYRRNRFAGEPFDITHTASNGTVTNYTVTIQYSDNNTLFFAPGTVNVDLTNGTWVGCVQLKRPGGIYLWSEDEFSLPPGWTTTQYIHELPTIVTRYGRHYKNDLVTPGLINELYHSIAKLRQVRYDGTFKSRDEDNDYVVQSLQDDEWNIVPGNANPPPADPITPPGYNTFASLANAWDYTAHIHDDIFDPVQFFSSEGDPNEKPFIEKRVSVGAATTNSAGDTEYDAGDDSATGRYAYYDGSVSSVFGSVPVYLYVKGQKWPPGGGPDDVSLFSNDGDPVLEGVFNLWSTAVSDSSGNWLSIALGHTDGGTILDAPDVTLDGTGRAWVSGYLLGDDSDAAIVDFGNAAAFMID